jgi:glycosyltransferase involved in cell wall biosynthesis
MPSDPELVSVIIPIFNGERFLKEAVASISRQALSPFELFIVDDGSTDGTAQVAAALDSSARYMLQPHRGQAAARNTGLNQAKGDIIAFLDADDTWSDDKLALQLDQLRKSPEAEVVLGKTRYAQENLNPQWKQRARAMSAPFLALSLGAALFRRSAFDRVGLFDEQLPYCEDIDWFLRAWETGIPITLHPEAVQFYRRHLHNITNERALDQSYFIRAVKMSLDRRRQGNGTARPLPPWVALSEYSAATTAGGSSPRPVAPKSFPAG